MTGPARAPAAAGQQPMDPAARRSAIRAFVRAHHPDIGGDPEQFAAGLRGLREPEGRPVAAGWPADDDPRLDVPVTVVTTRTRAFSVISRLARRIRRMLTGAVLRRIRGRNNPR